MNLVRSCEEYGAVAIDNAIRRLDDLTSVEYAAEKVMNLSRDEKLGTNTRDMARDPKVEYGPPADIPPYVLTDMSHDFYYPAENSKDFKESVKRTGRYQVR